MNVYLFKLRSPDFILGKLLVFGKAVLDSARVVICRWDAESVRFARLMFAVKPQYTMVTNKNLATLCDLVQRANRLNLEGDIVECGVWNGGSAAIMAFANTRYEHIRSDRCIWLFDSFQGLPKATAKDGALERESFFDGWNKGSVEKVSQAFTKLGLSLDRVKIIPGWFNDTLRNSPIEQIAILHIDADWYDSVKLVLDAFYDKVVPGGFIILNDYNTWEGCNRALDDFLTERQLKHVVITEVEPTTGAYFQKPLESH